jgi:multiple sugar transport system permease protein
MRHRRRIRARLLVDGLIAAVILVTALGPIAWGLSTSLKAPARIVEYPPQLIPDEPTLEHYANLASGGFARFMWNSASITVATVVVCLVFGTLAGYALARYRFRGRQALLFGIIAVMSIPLPSLVVPTFTFASTLGLIDTHLILVLLYSAYQLPLAAWIIMGFLTTVPEQIERAALVDGYSRIQTLWRIVVPLSTPGLVAAALFVIIFAWNDFIVALVMTNSEAVRTLPVAIYFFLGFHGRDWGPLTAAAMVSIVPVVILFVFLQRYFLSGMTGGAVKG